MPSSIINWLNNHWHATISHAVPPVPTRCGARPLDLAPVFWCVPLPRNRFLCTAAGFSKTHTHTRTRKKKILRERINLQDWFSGAGGEPNEPRVNAAARRGEERENYLTPSLIIIPKWSLGEGARLSVINCGAGLIKRRITCLTFCRRLTLTSSQSSGTQSG